MPTISEVIRETTSRLVSIGISPDEASIEARYILQSVFSCESAQLLAMHSEPFPPTSCKQLETLMSRRAAREPLAYILGEREFYGLSFVVDHRVLIPRPETEQLIDLCLEFVNQNHLKSPTICDVGTGSGCIAITLAKKLPNARITAFDISSDALQLAKINAANHNADIEFLIDDAARPQTQREFDIVISNPPYIKSDILLNLEPEVRDWEPQQALNGGFDGMRVVEPLIRSIPDLQVSCKPCATFIEIDPPIADQCLEVAHDVLPDRYTEIRRDYAGLERFLIILNV